MGAGPTLLVNMPVIWKMMAVDPGLLSVRGTSSVNLPPHPFPTDPVFPHALPKSMTGGGGSCEVAKAGIGAAIAMTGTDQAAPRTTVRRE
ncbi:hypothetical protein ASG76_11060 [Nocardioides sp. Soil774]|nr:hypothetical protein ASG76_11060 [Nocardioides sp. Soil774]